MLSEAKKLYRQLESKPPREGHCFANAFWWALSNRHEYKTIRVVHGYPRHKGYPMGHAWVEWRGYCYDPYLDVRIPKAEFYDELEIKAGECKSYTPMEALEIMQEEMDYGPWHDRPENAVFRDKRKRSKAGEK